MALGVYTHTHKPTHIHFHNESDFKKPGAPDVARDWFKIKNLTSTDVLPSKNQALCEF